MLTTIEMASTCKGVPLEHPYYDKKFLEQELNYKTNFFFFLRDLCLIIYFCLKNKRFRKITKVIFKLLNQIKKNKENAPSFLLKAFIELGPTFIKIGQFLSSRSDLLPNEYINELSKLQDSLPPVSFYEIKHTVEKELRKPLDNIFKSFEVEPIASASIGQVHKATLLNDQEVAVKIQRQNLNNIFYQDLAILRCFALFFQTHTNIGKDREWVQIVDEIGKTLFEEIDFIQEGRNADRLRKNLKYEDRICIPKVFWQYTTKKLITIEYIPGIKITDVEKLKEKNIDLKGLSKILVNAYFKQVFEDGFYHADPHPGNIVVKDDGSIVFYDFGMVGRITETIRAELLNVLGSVITNDTDTLLNTLKKLELIKQDVDIEPMKKIIEEAVYKYYDGEKLSDLKLEGVEEDLKKMFEEKPIRLPSKFAYTLRATGTLEGVCRTLDPDFSLVSVAKPYLQEWFKEKFHENKWLYLKTLFPNQNKLIDKVKIYYEVIKDLPRRVSIIEQEKIETPRPNVSTESMDINQKEDIKLRLSYSIIILLCFVFVGNYLIHAEYHFANVVGVILLCTSFLGSIGTVVWALIKRNAKIA